MFSRLKINSPAQGVTETGVFGVGARPTKCFDTHKGLSIQYWERINHCSVPVSSLSPRGTILAWLLVQLLRNGTSH